ncbi:hypothetical protein [Micromonospora terminaliae]|uniref:hypothetical protein n=1 Tax=Micromonospora terminaliae TaxID=1914461 RepID=UPI001EF7C51A|nr:hypothetical protein [Micromonospora terminaliae]
MSQTPHRPEVSHTTSAISYLGEEEEADARETVSLVEQAGRTGVAVRCDVREEANCRNLIERYVTGEILGVTGGKPTK